MCTVLLPPGVNTIAVDQYTVSYIITPETAELTVSTAVKCCMETAMLKLSNFTPQFTTYHAASQLVAMFLLVSVMPDRPCSNVQCKAAGYPLHSHLSPSFPLPCVTLCHPVPNAQYQLSVQFRGFPSEHCVTWQVFTVRNQHLAQNVYICVL
jgi:hypothetical protein